MDAHGHRSLSVCVRVRLCKSVYVRVVPPLAMGSKWFLVSARTKAPVAAVMTDLSTLAHVSEL
jgi:hypothetical protein